MQVFEKVSLHSLPSSELPQKERIERILGAGAEVNLQLTGWPANFWEFRRIELAPKRGTMIATTSTNFGHAMREAHRNFALDPVFRSRVATDNSPDLYVFDDYIVARTRTVAAVFMNALLGIQWNCKPGELVLLPNLINGASSWHEVVSLNDETVTVIAAEGRQYTVPRDRILYVDTMYPWKNRG